MRYSVFLSLLFLHTAFAAIYYCPNTSKYIRTGDSLSAVEQNCGAPTDKLEKERQTPQTEKFEQWFYNFSSGPEPKIGNVPDTVFTFKEEKLAKITLNNQEVSSTSVCDGKTILKQGDSPDTVRAVCQVPSFVNTGEETLPGEKHTVIQWIYNYGPYQPQVTLEFEDDKLTQIKIGN